MTTSLTDLLLDILPPDGSTLGNLSARKALSGEIGKEEYEAIRDKGVDLGLIVKGGGRGGSVALAEGIEGGSRYEAPSAPAAGNGRRKATAPAAPEPTFQIGQKLTLPQLESFL